MPPFDFQLLAGVALGVGAGAAEPRPRHGLDELRVTLAVRFLGRQRRLARFAHLCLLQRCLEPGHEPPLADDDRYGAVGSSLFVGTGVLRRFLERRVEQLAVGVPLVVEGDDIAIPHGGA